MRNEVKNFVRFTLCVLVSISGAMLFNTFTLVPTFVPKTLNVETAINPVAGGDTFDLRDANALVEVKFSFEWIEINNSTVFVRRRETYKPRSGNAFDGLSENRREQVLSKFMIANHDIVKLPNNTVQWRSIIWMILSYEKGYIVGIVLFVILIVLGRTNGWYSAVQDRR